jgi:hypothetical protein
MMNNDKVVKAWQQKILVDCEHILKRQLTDAETAFVRGRAGFIALELIEGPLCQNSCRLQQLEF